jgi:hypothetical protein
MAQEIITLQAFRLQLLNDLKDLLAATQTQHKNEWFKKSGGAETTKNFTRYASKFTC